MDKIEITLEQLRELIQTPTEVLAKQEEILKELKEIREILKKEEAPNITLPYVYPPYQPYTAPSIPTTYPPQVWYTTATPLWQYTTTSTTDTKQTLND